MSRVCYKIRTLVPRINSEPGLRMKDNSPIELCVSKYALFCVSMPSKHKELLEITASCFTDDFSIPCSDMLGTLTGISGSAALAVAPPTAAPCVRFRSIDAAGGAPPIADAAEINMNKN